MNTLHSHQNCHLDAARACRKFYFGLTHFGKAILFLLILTTSPGVAWGQSKPTETTSSPMQSGAVIQTQTQQAVWPNLKYAIYFCSGEIEKLLSSPTTRRQTLDYFAPVRPVHIYLEGPNRRPVDAPLMKEIAEALRKEGIRVSGAVVPVGPKGPFCYNDPEQMVILETRVRAMAGIFDELILDDWLFTNCTCEKCVAGRGTSSWGDYRTRLLLEKSKKHILDAAKQVNPNIRVIIKYPNWYEGHRENGYDVYGETHQFDAVAIGIETRTRATHDQHIPIYSGYVYQKWFSSVDPSKWIGSWLDNYTMAGQDNDYVAQVWQAVLARTPEIILWSGGHLHSTGPFSDVYPHFREMLPEFNKVAGMLSGASRGVPIYLPYGSSGEYNIFGHLGMAGIPLDPVGQFPANSPIAIFTRHSLKDPDLAEKMLTRLRLGRDVFMTWELFQQLRSTEFKNILLRVDEGGSLSSSHFRLRGSNPNEQNVEAERPFDFPRVATTTWPEAREVALVREDYDYGMLMKVKYLQGNLVVLNMPENSYDLIRLPARVLDRIRRSFLQELGVQMEGPGGIGFYLFGHNQYVLYSMRDSSARVTLRFEKKLSPTGWRELVHGKQLAVTETKPRGSREGDPQTEVSFELQPFELTIVQAP